MPSSEKRAALEKAQLVLLHTIEEAGKSTASSANVLRLANAYALLEGSVREISRDATDN